MKIELDVPSLIDGDPADVESDILATMPVLMDALADYIDSACKQLANAERQRILDNHPSISGENLASVYDESARAGTLARLNGGAKVLVGAATEL